MTLFVGVDPGLDGGIAAVDEAGRPAWREAMPFIGTKGKGKRLLDQVGVLRMMRFLAAKGVVGVALEIQQSMPGQGVASTFQIGRGFGALEMVVPALGLALHPVRPQAWQKVMLAGTPDSMEDTKDRAALAAQRLWPTLDLREHAGCRKPHDGIVDALLLAEWLRTQSLHRHINAA